MIKYIGSKRTLVPRIVAGKLKLAFAMNKHDTIGQDFAWRNYFHGGEQDLEPGATTGRLRAVIHHFSVRSLGDQLDKLNRYSDQQADDLMNDRLDFSTSQAATLDDFLGLGERYVLIDPSTIFLHRTDGGLKAMVDADKDALKNAPEFKYNKMTRT